jgi:transcriptional regulator with XRE-family HTH domain
MLDEIKVGPPRTSVGPDGADNGDRRPSPIDVHVGARIRLRRTLLAMSQERLGDALGMTYQQVQKYERGVNRVSASRLFDLSRVLDVPISFFFDDLPDTVGENSAIRRPMTRSETTR